MRMYLLPLLGGVSLVLSACASEPPEYGYGPGYAPPYEMGFGDPYFDGGFGYYGYDGGYDRDRSDHHHDRDRSPAGPPQVGAVPEQGSGHAPPTAGPPPGGADNGLGALESLGGGAGAAASESGPAGGGDVGHGLGALQGLMHR